MDESRRCTARSKRSGRRCRKAAVRGASTCHIHGMGKKGSPQRKVAEIRAAQMAAHEQAERMVARAGLKADPIEHLAECLHRAAALVEVYGGMVADLDNAGEVEAGGIPGRIRGWSQRTLEEGPDERWRWAVQMDPLMVQTSDKTVQLHPFVKEYHDALERRAKFAKLCIDAGLSERMVSLAEQQGQMMVRVISAALDSPKLGLTAQQKQIARKSVASQLRKLTLVKSA